MIKFSDKLVPKNRYKKKVGQSEEIASRTAANFWTVALKAGQLVIDDGC